jgi:hypothetical protein
MKYPFIFVFAAVLFSTLLMIMLLNALLSELALLLRPETHREI